MLSVPVASTGTMGSNTKTQSAVLDSKDFDTPYRKLSQYMDLYNAINTVYRYHKLLSPCSDMLS